MPSLVVIGPQIKEKQRGGDTPAYMVPKDPSLNRVKTVTNIVKSSNAGIVTKCEEINLT